MRVLLIHPPVRVHRAHIDYPLFTGLAVWHTAAMLEQAGHAVRVLDAFAVPGATLHPEESRTHLGLPAAQLAARLADAPFDAVVLHLSPFSVQQPEPSPLRELIAAMRRHNPEIPVILADMHIGGMNYLAYDPARYLKQPWRPDWLVRYEPEIALPALLASLEGGAGPLPDRQRAIDGEPPGGPLSSYDGRLYAHADLPAFRAFLARALAADTRPRPFALDSGTLPFKSSRGCCFSCRFCTSNPAAAAGFRREWRPFEPEQLRAQLRSLTGAGGVTRLWVLDEAANIGGEHFDRLLDGLEEAGLPAEFPNGLRADRLSDAQLERLAGRIGCLSLSPESGSAFVLDRLIGKRQSLEAVERVTRRARELGLAVALHFIVGLPGERREDIHATFTLARRLFDECGARPWVQFAVALPGTPLFARCQAKGLLPDPLPTDYGPVFQGGPMLKDGACGLSNADLLRLRDALERYTGRG